MFQVVRKWGSKRAGLLLVWLSGYARIDACFSGSAGFGVQTRRGVGTSMSVQNGCRLCVTPCGHTFVESAVRAWVGAFCVWMMSFAGD